LVLFVACPAWNHVSSPVDGAASVTFPTTLLEHDRRNHDVVGIRPVRLGHEALVAPALVWIHKRIDSLPKALIVLPKALVVSPLVLRLLSPLVRLVVTPLIWLIVSPLIGILLSPLIVILLSPLVGLIRAPLSLALIGIEALIGIKTLIGIEALTSLVSPHDTLILLKAIKCTKYLFSVRIYVQIQLLIKSHNFALISRTTTSAAFFRVFPGVCLCCAAGFRIFCLLLLQYFDLVS
jgi:hypothetical protein